MHHVIFQKYDFSTLLFYASCLEFASSNTFIVELFVLPKMKPICTNYKESHFEARK